MNERDGALRTGVNGSASERLGDRQAAAFARLQAAAEHNADWDPDEILAEVTEEVEAVRQDRHERQAAARRR